jgi:hypothetical protein
MKRFGSFFVVFALFVVLATPAVAQQFEYPNNKDKSFTNPNEFYEQLKKNEFKEYKNATFSVRQKVSYKEIPNVVMTFEKKTGRYHCQSKEELSSSIHPERQVYFFASFVQTNNKEYWKHTIIDAETKRQIGGGNAYHNYENPYR